MRSRRRAPGEFAQFSLQSFHVISYNLFGHDFIVADKLTREMCGPSGGKGAWDISKPNNQIAWNS
jgi:hypothetical protein